MRKLVLLIAVLVVVGMLFTACERGGGAGGRAAAGGGDLIGVSLFSLEIPFPIATYEGVRRAAAHYGANVTIVDNHNDMAKNVSDIEDLKAAGISALLLMPVDNNAVTPVVLDAIASGIKVVSVNRLVANVPLDGRNHVWVGSDNVMGGAAKARRVLDLIPAGTNVIILEGTPGAASGIDRLQGFRDTIGNTYNILASQTANFNRVDGMHVSENLLTAHPSAQVILAMNDEMALGAIEAALAVGRRPGVDILITGYDGNADARTAVANGEMLFTVYQDPDGMGYKGLEVALGLLRGETFEPRINFDIGFVER